MSNQYLYLTGLHIFVSAE